MPRLCSILLLSLLFASSASAVTMAWTPIGNPGNACDPQPTPPNNPYTPGGCFGGVPYTYSIGTYDVTNAQYIEFLNAKAVSDPLALYDTAMVYSITRSGSSGSYVYSAVAGREDMPVNYVSFFDALRFTNWMNNGQGNAGTESGAYTLLGGSAIPSNSGTIARNAGAAIVLPSENEWYKAAYYAPGSATYFDYPAGSNSPTTCSAPTAALNSANCNGYDVTPVGSYTGSPSPYGTFDQGGDVLQWNEAVVNPTYGCSNCRGNRGGAWSTSQDWLAASFRSYSPDGQNDSQVGFRLAMIPEPSSGLLVIAGLLGLGIRRRIGA
jgi:formylglycine-generating enzyme